MCLLFFIFFTFIITCIHLVPKYSVSPLEIPSESNGGEAVDFVHGLKLVCGSGDPTIKTGCAIYNYAFNSSMGNKSFYNSDGYFLIAPQQGTLLIKTEMGKLVVEPRDSPWYQVYRRLGCRH